MIWRDQVSHLKTRFQEYESKVCIFDLIGDRKLTYAKLSKLSLNLADWLTAQGLQKGDSIAFIMESSLEAVLLYFASWNCGAKVIPIYHDLTDLQVNSLLASATPKLLLIQGDVEKRSFDLPNGKTITFSTTSSKENPDHVNIWQTANISSRQRAPFLEGLHDESIFLRVYTSGTTAAPKGIDIQAGKLLANERAFSDLLGINFRSRFYNILPIAYLGGIHNLMLLPMVNGASIVLDVPLGPRNIFSFWNNVREFEINTLWFSPTMLSLLLSLRNENEKQWAAELVNLALVGMAPLPIELREQFEERFGIKLFENYALSETAFISSHSPSKNTRPLSKGRVLPHIDVQAIDSEGNVINGKTPGELRVKTPYLFDSYSNADQADHKNIQGEWFLTGDIGYVDQGELYVVDRKKDLIIRGGLNIAPASVESVLLQNSFIKEAAVFGMDHPIYGEEVGAAVSLKSNTPAEFSTSTLLEFVAERMSPFHRPKKVWFLEDIPKGHSGKIDKKRLKEICT